MALLSGDTHTTHTHTHTLSLSRFLFTPVSLTGSFIAKRIAQVESISQNDVYAWNNNSITDRLFQSKETGGISLHSRRRNARRESWSATCTWGRFIRCAAASPAVWRCAKEFPLHFSTMYQPLRTTLSYLFLFIYLTRRIATVSLCRLCEL